MTDTSISAPAARRVPRKTEAELSSLIESVRGAIRAAGAVPPERDLAAGLGVKRHQLRKALKVMRETGEIEPHAGRAETAPWHELAHATNPLEVIELRSVLEPALARLAALRASPLQVDQIIAAVEDADESDYGGADLRFHKAVADGARNGLASEFYRLLRAVGTDSRLRLGLPSDVCPKRRAERDAEHRAIANAIAARDPETAEREMRRHLANVQAQVMDRLKV
ncbi:FadR family transcriptional regulator [Nordella sp. HKS 07]|uniref:FadR/GntR family transcriptional regulator n=1 Tax=Nordella sp. HKS 07 TaxID=2712222 RepID=UPI0013E1A2F7|nr:FCD domain-containing protein [Nordella sp. HKS 07]QIG50254.1 FadR family transcriptional regulator [Nordella sp. HKS 07]